MLPEAEKHEKDTVAVEAVKEVKEKHDEGKDENKDIEEDAEKKVEICQTEHGKVEGAPAEVADVDGVKENQAEKKSEVQLEDSKGEDAPSEVAEVHEKVEQKHTETAEEKKHQPEQEQSDEQQNVVATKSTEGENALLNRDISKKAEEEVTDNGNKADEAADA
ncbi:hypothetical protein K7X08_020793 [Anisodus acutangulus]|uniref:Uncharacterized protein n=1 Tax=Anisodus acutangulus TaxID=402998 RepID=A0A9Q1MWJ5_9SOLA|nr:hypothetical protein K7X08_020793 [Anisodus acutangulus]